MTNSDSLKRKELSNKLRHQIKTCDISLRTVSVDNNIRVSFCNATHLTREVIRRHELLSRTNEHTAFLQLLGTHLVFTNLLSALQ